MVAAWGPALLVGVSPANRIDVAEAALKAGGQAARSELGQWINRLVPVETLVPEAHQAWRPLVRDAFGFVFSQLSDRRLATKIVEQMKLPADTPPERRLIRLISKMPGLQKLGQVLARNRGLAPALQKALCELENGMSDVTADEIHAIVAEQLGSRLDIYGVEMESSIFKEGSASAILQFTWRSPDRERGAFKVLKPYVPECFAEDMTLLQQLGEFLADKNRAYGFAVRDLKEMVAEVRLLLEHELDFPREQATLREAHRLYRGTFGIRVPRLIQPLCTTRITAMTAENGVKVTEAFRRSPVRRKGIAAQLIEGLIAVPLFSRGETAVFHADPHAGNLLYDEPNRELVILDWALADRLSRQERRHLVMLAVMTILRNPAGVSEAIQALSRRDRRGHHASKRWIDIRVKRFFTQFPEDRSPGVLDAMMLLDEIALEGVRFPAALFMFRKILFTLDGVLHDVAGPGVRIDYLMASEFLTRWAASLGLFYAPLEFKDCGAVAWNALRYAGQVFRGPTPSPTKSRHPRKTLQTALRRR
jgi:ubiquinone biosynthesis protein